MKTAYYVSKGRNGHGAIDYFEDEKLISNVTSGIKPLYLADHIATWLNIAVGVGRKLEAENRPPT